MSLLLETALHDAFTGLVAGNVHQTVLPDRPRYPAITIMLVGSHPDVTLCGESTVTEYRYRIDVYAETRKETVQIATSVKAIMRRFAWTNAPEMEMDGYEPEVRQKRRTLDFSVTETAGVDPRVRAARRAARLA